MTHFESHPAPPRLGARVSSMGGRQFWAGGAKCSGGQLPSQSLRVLYGKGLQCHQAQWLSNPVAQGVCGEPSGATSGGEEEVERAGLCAPSHPVPFNQGNFISGYVIWWGKICFSAKKLWKPPFLSALPDSLHQNIPPPHKRTKLVNEQKRRTWSSRAA